MIWHKKLLNKVKEHNNLEVMTRLEKQSLLRKWPGLETLNLPTAFV
jgi:hypothetical protein